jgi:hypothetical protein
VEYTRSQGLRRDGRTSSVLRFGSGGYSAVRKKVKRTFWAQLNDGYRAAQWTSRPKVYCLNRAQLRRALSMHPFRISLLCVQRDLRYGNFRSHRYVENRI